MKIFSAALICVALLLASRAQADDLDELLRDRVGIEAPQVVRPEVATTSETSSVPEPRFSEPHDLHAVIAASVANPAASPSAPVVNQKDDVPNSVSLVPEPSAVALAVCALAYFLLFGRRRSLA